jgi:hypothetical protein
MAAIIWFRCEAKMIRKENGEPWFIHGVGFDITDLKRTEEASRGGAQGRLRHSRYGRRLGGGSRPAMVESSALTALVNRSTGYFFAEAAGRKIWDLFLVPEDVENVFKACRSGHERRLRTAEHLPNRTT